MTDNQSDTSSGVVNRRHRCAAPSRSLAPHMVAIPLLFLVSHEVASVSSGLGDSADRRGGQPAKRA